MLTFVSGVFSRILPLLTLAQCIYQSRGKIKVFPTVPSLLTFRLCPNGTFMTFTFCVQRYINLKILIKLNIRNIAINKYSKSPKGPIRTSRNRDISKKILGDRIVRKTILSKGRKAQTEQEAES